MSVSPEEFEFAEAWRPEAGELIEGKVVEITTRGGGEYGDYPIVTLELDSGEHRALHLFHTVARNEFARIAPQVGDRVAVIYKGKTTRSDGPDFHSYRAKKVGGDAQPFNWGGEQQTATEDPTPSENGHDPTKASEPLKVADKNIPF